MTELDEKPDYAEYHAKRLASYRASFEATGNGCWAWMAINLCLGGETPWNPTSPPPLPDWALAYMREAAAFVYRVGMPAGPILRDAVAEADNSNAPGDMMKILGLAGTRKGENRFRDFANDMKAVQFALVARDGGMEHAVAVAKRVDAGSTPRKVKESVARGRRRLPYLEAPQEDAGK